MLGDTLKKVGKMRTARGGKAQKQVTKKKAKKKSSVKNKNKSTVKVKTSASKAKAQKEAIRKKIQARINKNKRK